MLHINRHIQIPDSELQEQFVRASGPGGQNVNKVATAVELRFDARRSPSLPEDVRRRLERMAGRRMTRDGIIVIQARRYRTQDRNRHDARDRLARLIRRATVAPKPRIKTRPTRASVERRLRSKAHRSRVKRLRRDRPQAED